MVEFCFETINWSPGVGFEHPDAELMVRAAAASGYQWIAFDIATIEYFLRRGGSLERLADDIAARGLKTMAVHSLPINGDPASTEQAARTAAGYCRTLGARFLNTGVVAPVDDAVIDSTRRAGAVCRDAGIQCSMEFFPFMPVNSIAATREILHKAQITGPCLIIDAWHFFMGPDNWETLASVKADEIAFVQLNDHPAERSENLLEETLHHRVMPGEGSFDLARFVLELDRIGYQGIVGPEILSRAMREWPMEEFAARALESSRRYWR